ncbi:nucleoside triphosphate pyrophosphohydrolase [Metabacillus herbersteinensis]|uniref:Nucleoside triphosphate pyrophosphohydrolase n=1 Tax=Metabacillus herbersteinensis TaxID=283816 RepID=A0ABV6GN04_9BACI
MTKVITVVGLGAGDLEQMPLGVYKLLTTTEHLFLRTKEHPVINQMSADLPEYQSFDSIYMENEQFEQVYIKIVEELYKQAENKEIVYAVPGHPLVAEQTVQLLIKEGRDKGYEIKIRGGQSFLDATFQALEIDPVEGFQLLDALTLKREELQLKQHIVITQVYDQLVASEVKLTLMEQLPDDYQIWIITAAGTSDQIIKKVPLFEMDRVTTVNNLTSVYIPPVQNEELMYHQFTKFRNVIAELRGPNGCPWDKKQTHHTLKKYLIEECYELLEAIEEEDIDHVIEELGDVLLQILLHAQIGEDEGMFTIDDVIKGITKKMIRRHPHVFGDVTVRDSEDVLKNWDEIKKQEGKQPEENSLLDSVATTLPALSKAYHLQKKAAKVGFDWPNIDGAWDKVKEEIQEFEEELNSQQDDSLMLQELGDVLFSLVNIARFNGVEPEEALASTNKKFYERFSFIEKKAKEQGKVLSEMALEEMDLYWKEAKKVN